MAQTVANLTDVLKEAWTSDRLEKQFLDDTDFLDRVDKESSEVRTTKIGEKAIVPLHKGRSGGYTSTSSAGGSLNAADAQKVDSAEYTLVYHWFQTALETGALNQSTGGDSSAVVAKDLELQGAVSDVANQCMRQIATNSDSIIATCGTTTTSATVVLAADSATAYGVGAIVRGWLYKGLKVDIGTTSDTDAVVAGATIVSVDEVNGTITIDSSVSTTANTHKVYIANPNSGTAFNPELEGLRSMAGSTTSALGGLDPDNAGEEFWKPAYVDTTTTVLSLALLLRMRRGIHQKTGKKDRRPFVLSGLKQEDAYYSLLQNQVRFGSDNVSAGNSDSVQFGNYDWVGSPNILDTDVFMLTLKDFVRVTGTGITKPTWVSDLQGSNNGMLWSAGTTQFADAVVYPWALGMRRRNGSSAALSLTA